MSLDDLFASISRRLAALEGDVERLRRDPLADVLLRSAGTALPTLIAPQAGGTVALTSDPGWGGGASLSGGTAGYAAFWSGGTAVVPRPLQLAGTALLTLHPQLQGTFTIPAPGTAVLTSGGTFTGTVTVPMLLIAGSNVVAAVPGAASSADRLDFMAQTSGKGAAFNLFPGPASDFAKFAMANQPNQSQFSSVFLEARGGTAYFSPQNVGSPGTAITVLDVGGGVGASAWGSLLLRGNVQLTTGHLTLNEQGAAPSAGGANSGILFLVDNGSGKTQLKVQFSSGTAILLATQP